MSQEEAPNHPPGKTGRPRKDDVPPDSFGGQLSKGLDDKGIKPEQLADILGVQRPSVVRWQRNQALPTPENVREINRILGTNLTRPPRTHASKGKSKIARMPSVRTLAPAGLLTEEQVKGFSDDELESYIRMYRKWLNRAEAILAARRKRRPPQ